MSSDVISDFLTIIRNGIMVSKTMVSAPYTKLLFSIATILKEEGFIKDVLVDGDGVNKKLVVRLKYVDGESVIHKIDRVSKSSCRVYSKMSAIKPVIGGLGISILSTNQGVMTQKRAKKLNVGGEVLCTVW